MSVTAWLVILRAICILGVLFIIYSFSLGVEYYHFAIGVVLIIISLLVSGCVIRSCPNCTSTQLTANHYCTNCGYDFEEDAIRYWECECGNKLPTSDKYCPYCGLPKEAK